MRLRVYHRSILIFLLWTVRYVYFYLSLLYYDTLTSTNPLFLIHTLPVPRHVREEEC